MLVKFYYMNNLNILVGVEFAALCVYSFETDCVWHIYYLSEPAAVR